MWYKLSTVLIVVTFLCTITTTTSLSCDLSGDDSSLLSFASDMLDLRTTPPDPTYSNYLNFQGLQLLLNSSNGILQVIESANNNVVWAWGLTGKNCAGTSGCHLVFQSDGNLVIYYPDGSAIGSSSYSENAGYVLFTTGGTLTGRSEVLHAKFWYSPPYISVVNYTCSQLWPNDKNGPNIGGPLPRTTPSVGVTFDTAVITLQALPASSWKVHFGVNTHCSQGWNSEMVYNMTTYLGVGAIRDEIPALDQAADYARMFAAGIRLNVVAEGAANKTLLGQKVQAWSNFQSTQPGMLLQIEGFNEINNFGFVYNGIDNTQTYAGMAQAMNDLYSLVKSTPNLAGLPVVDLTGGGFSDGPAYNLTNFVGHADFGNQHVYPNNGWPSVSIGGACNYYILGLAGTYPSWQNPTSNFAVTETGYHTDNYTDGITELAQSKLVVNMLLNAMAYGFKQTFIYELWDEVWAGYSGSESHYGLFRNDKTTKPVARALHFLSELLNDTSAFSGPLGQLTFNLKDLPVGTQYMLLQNSNMTYFLILWSNVPVYNPQSQTDLVANPVQVTLSSLPHPMSICIYDIYDTNASDEIPLPPVTTVVSQTIQFSMGDQAVVLTLSPQSGSTSTSTSTSGGPSAICCHMGLVVVLLSLAFLFL